MLRDLIGRDHISSGDRWTGDVSLPSSSNSTSAADSVTRSLDDIAAALLPPVADASADHLRTAADAAIITDTDQACYEQFLQEKRRVLELQQSAQLQSCSAASPTDVICDDLPEGLIGAVSASIARARNGLFGGSVMRPPSGGACDAQNQKGSCLIS